MTAPPGLRLRHLAFIGPEKPAASITFGPGLNVLYGASETGKSFVVRAIDFMLGGRRPLKEIPERVGYDRVLLGAETLGGETFTLQRSVDGGPFRVSVGLRFESLDSDAEATVLGAIHDPVKPDNLSTFLLDRCNLSKKRIRKNRLNDTQGLSFRNLAHFAVVDETTIMSELSPLSDGNPSTETPNLSVLKLLLTGIDDSSLDATKPKEELESREAQLTLLEDLLQQQRKRLKTLTKDPTDVAAQLERIDATLAGQSEALTVTETDYRRLSTDRRELRKSVEADRERAAEIAALLERFALLDSHYVSDLARLKSIEEAGTLFDIMGEGPCPLCGADAAHHQHDGAADANVSAVVAAAAAEIAQIEVLRRELKDTVTDLSIEASSYERRLPRREQQLQAVSEQVEKMIAPKLGMLRSSYRELADKRGQAQAALNVVENIQELETLRENMERPDSAADAVAVTNTIPASVSDSFAKTIEAMLTAWHFPNPDRVFFDQGPARDLIISGKPRTARGKGLRALTYAAFTLGLLEYCRQHEKHHPGFAILDSPLLAYKEPEGAEDDLRDSDVKDQFFAYLRAWPNDRQVLVVENVEPPESFRRGPQVIEFTGNPARDRYGFFPYVPKAENHDEMGVGRDPAKKDAASDKPNGAAGATE